MFLCEIFSLKVKLIRKYPFLQISRVFQNTLHVIYDYIQVFRQNLHALFFKLKNLMVVWLSVGIFT